MKSQVKKRININLTDKELVALECLKDEMVTRNWKMTTSDIIREAIVYYCMKETGHTFANEWKPKESS
jgi:hypothetical protein